MDRPAPLSPALQAAAELERTLVKAIDRLNYPEQPMTGFVPYVAPKPATPAPTPQPLTRGSRPMGAPAIRRLSSVLKTAIEDIVKEAESVATEVVAEVAAFKQTVGEARQLKDEIKGAHGDLKATLGLTTNGAGDDTPTTGPLDGQARSPT